MSKFELREKFPRFPNFRFCLWGQMENWETSILLCYDLKFYVFVFLLFLYLSHNKVKNEKI